MSCSNPDVLYDMCNTEVYSDTGREIQKLVKGMSENWCMNNKNSCSILEQEHTETSKPVAGQCNQHQLPKGSPAEPLKDSSMRLDSSSGSNCTENGLTKPVVESSSTSLEGSVAQLSLSDYPVPPETKESCENTASKGRWAPNQNGCAGAKRFEVMSRKGKRKASKKQAQNEHLLNSSGLVQANVQDKYVNNTTEQHLYDQSTSGIHASNKKDTEIDINSCKKPHIDKKGKRTKKKQTKNAPKTLTLQHPAASSPDSNPVASSPDKNSSPAASFPDKEKIRVQAEESWSHHLEQGHSLVVELFQGQLVSTLECDACKHVLVKFDTFMFWPITVPLHNSTVSLDECLRLYTNEDIIDGWPCSVCCGEVKVKRSVLLWNTPPFLMLYLKRYKLDKLDLSSSHMQTPKGEKPLYNLCAVINHVTTIAEDTVSFEEDMGNII
eukprot:Em0005g158a